MEKINGKLIEEYKQLESKSSEQNKNLASLEEKLKSSQKELNKASTILEGAESEAKNNNLIIVKEIENARKKVAYAKYTVSDHRQVSENLKHAITNAGTSVQNLHNRKAVIERKIWEDYRELLRAEIKDILNGRMEKLWTAIICVNPGIIPTHLGFPDDLNRFMGRREYKDMRNTLLKEILNGNNCEAAPSEQMAPSST